MPREVNESNGHVALRRHLHRSGLSMYPHAEEVVARHLKRYAKSGLSHELALRFACELARWELSRD